MYNDATDSLAPSPVKSGGADRASSAKPQPADCASLSQLWSAPGVSSLSGGEEQFDAIDVVKPPKFGFLWERGIAYRR